MFTRQLIESFGIGRKIKLFDFDKEYKTDPNIKNQHPRNYPAVSEMGKLLVNILYGVKLCATNTTNSCKTNSLLYYSLKRSKNIYKQTDLTAAE